MTVAEFVAELRATAVEPITSEWIEAQQARAASYGLDWQEITALIAQEQAEAVEKAAEAP